MISGRLGITLCSVMQAEERVQIGLLFYPFSSLLTF
jgi:hypothetical protein